MVKSHAVLISSCIIAARITPPKISLAKSKHKSPSFSKTKFVLKSLYPFIKAKIYVFPEPINKTKEFVSQSTPNRFLGRIPTNCQNDSFTLTRMLYSRASDESPSVSHSTPPANLLHTGKAGRAQAGETRESQRLYLPVIVSFGIWQQPSLI